MIAIYQGEKKLGDLVARLYPRLKPEEAKRTEAALLKANPHLAELGELKPGALIVVPPARGGSRAGAKAEHEGPGAQAIGAVRDGLEQYRARLGAAIEAEEAAISSATELVKSRDLKQLVKDAPEAEPWVEQAAGALKGRRAEAEEGAAFLKVVAKARADLAAMVKRVEEG